jgi:uncharacterized membrane protein
MMMRSTLPILLLIAALTSGAGAQSIGIDPQTLRPGLRFRTNADAADNFKRLPYQDLAGEIRIELAADTLYDFD